MEADRRAVKDGDDRERVSARGRGSCQAVDERVQIKEHKQNRVRGAINENAYRCHGGHLLSALVGARERYGSAAGH